MAEPRPDANDDALRRAHALAVEFYVEARWAAVESERVFARSWQLVADASRVAAPGDHVVDTIAGRPLLVVRGADGTLRAFYNVCKHRAGPIALADGRGARHLRCRYHGWSYGLDGQLRTAPEMDDAHDFDCATIALTPLRVHEWQGLVFVAMDAATPPFAQVWGGIAERIAPLDLATLRFAAREHYDLACNWKVYVDNFLEGYHLPHVHPGLSRVLDYRAYDTVLSAWHSLQHAPMRNAQTIYGDGEAWYFFVWPNVMLNITPGRLQTNRVLPLGTDRCRVEFEWFLAGDATAQQRAGADKAFSDEIQREDIAICEQVQRGLASGVYAPGRLCPARERGVWHFHQLLRAAYEQPGA
jgi:choline monooxygenase